MSSRMPWWGWAEPGSGPGLSRAAERFVRSEIGLADKPTPPVAVTEIAPRESELPADVHAQLVDVVGTPHVRLDLETRLVYAAGRSYIDLMRLRTGKLIDLPDAVVGPGGHDEVMRVLAVCSRHRVAVVPFGGGTSVVGGVAPLRDGCVAVIALDLSRMNQLLSIDRESLIATFQPGITGPEAEAALTEHGCTLGHFPQSFERASLGGYAATRSAGQASTGYGRIDELVVGLRIATPAGELRVGRGPASAAGPDLRQLFLGSEGTFGVITELSARLHPAPDVRHYEAWLFHSFDEGVAAYRALAQEGIAPDIARLSDEDETRATLAMAGIKRRVTTYLRLRGYARRTLAIVGWEGSAEAVKWRRHVVHRTLRRGGGLSLGTKPGQAWAHARYDAPYLRDELLARGVLAETLETATTWAGLRDLHRSVAAALRTALPGALVGCHVSHLYATGASLYFTVLGPPGEDPIARWTAAKHAASAAISAAGATISHHHAVGADHRPYLTAEIGPLGVQALRAVKEELDPAGILNPGKLLPEI